MPSFASGMALGAVVALAALGIAAAALRRFREQHTTTVPGEVPSSLITSGVYRRSRNPLYLSLVLMLGAIALMADSVALAVSALLLAVVLDRLIIRSEERILDREFGEAWRAYRSRVRRWL